MPLSVLPFTTSLILQYTATFERIQNFALKPEIEEQKNDNNPNEPLSNDNILYFINHFVRDYYQRW